MLESLAKSVINVLDNEKHYENLCRFTCIKILKRYYDTDRDKYDTVVKIIKERRKMDKEKELKNKIQELKNKMEVCAYGKEELFELRSLEKELDELEME